MGTTVAGQIVHHANIDAESINVASGTAGKVVEKAIRMTKDITVMEGNKVISHVHIKDAINCIEKTAEQVNVGEYTAITAKAAGNAKLAAGDAGIVGTTSKQIAGKALGRMPIAGAVSGAAKAGGIWGAVAGAGIETVSSISDVMSGEKEFEDAACDVVYAGVKGGAAGYAGAAAGTVAAGATSAAIVATGIGTGLAAGGAVATAVAFAPVVAGFGAAYVVGSLVSDLFDDIFG